MEVLHEVKVSDQPRPRVMRRLPVRGRRSVDRGCAGRAIELRNQSPPGCRPSYGCGKAARCAAISRVAYRTRGVLERVQKVWTGQWVNGLISQHGKTPPTKEVPMSDIARSRQSYPSDLSQKEWERLQPLVPMPKKVDGQPNTSAWRSSMPSCI